ncbi:nucleotide-binding domain-containing protein [Ornithobacterium rhinotracheale]|uniref:nucleotide-binding domain-containing protein n=3 Tax=Ornithobacterium rhinotracheale TaxID=28251 RepID=UPI001FF0E286|nr:hypothetical protein [Ornithobacterium rhinotracheale]MCK0201034.1 hypothetical protein [Ornithobacterium rhinotracheale]
MNVSENFKAFIDNLKIPENKAEIISSRYGRITKTLNKKFRNTESEISNRLQVGSYGRFTGIKSISDLDMLYIMPESKWESYDKKNGQKKLLNDTRDAIKTTYPQSIIKVDRCVVKVEYTDSHIDIQPVFENDEDFKYPDTYNEGSWKITKPKKEILAMKDFTENKNKNLRNLCRMARAWKNKQGVQIGGLLIDTLVYNFLKQTSNFDDKSFGSYDEMSRDFFDYLRKQPKDQKEYSALGSNQRVKVKRSFTHKAKKAYNLAVKAIEETDEKKQHEKWRDLFGRNFPKYQNEEVEAKATNTEFENTEEYIEDRYKIEIQYELKIDCEVSQNGFRIAFLSDLLSKKQPLFTNKKLRFFIKNIENLDVPLPYDIKWKVRNRGTEAIKRNCIRGQIEHGEKSGVKIENTNFKGEHFVECYIIKDNTVVAIDSIDVPISI